MTGTQKTALDDLKIDRNAPAKKSALPAILIAIVLLVLAVGTGWMLTRPKTPEVRTILVQETSGQGGGGTVLNASGYVTARRQATVSSKVTGKVIEVSIEEGMNVKEGQILARIDDSNVQANLRLVAAQAELAKSSLAETKVRILEAEREWKRVAGLAVEKIASVAELDRAEAQFNSLKARLDSQQNEITVAERQLALWQQQVDDTVIRAPFSGIVVTKNAQPGEMISPVSAGGGFTRTGIGTIVDMASLEIEVDVNESFINRVESGQPVVATLDSYPEWKIPCKVIAIIPTADRQKATVKVRIGFDELDRRILPDMGVKVGFQSADDSPRTRAVISIPKSAVRKIDGRSVALVVKDGKVEHRAVSVGDEQATTLTVLAGLTAGERVVVEGPAELGPGAQVGETNR